MVRIFLFLRTNMIGLLTHPTWGKDLDIFQPEKPNLKTGAFELSVVVLTEAANIASTVPYMAPIASIFLQIVKIKGVRFYFAFDRPLLSKRSRLICVCV